MQRTHPYLIKVARGGKAIAEFLPHEKDKSNEYTVLMSNLDNALARIELAYCNSPVCGATRLSVLTGIRAQPNQWKTNHMSEEFTTLPAHFKNFGNHTVSIGKVFQIGRASCWVTV